VRFGAPYQDASGVVVLRPLRVCDEGCSEDRLESYLDRLELLVEAGELFGATTIDWG
jgi:hypothetical protein